MPSLENPSYSSDRPHRRIHIPSPTDGDEQPFTPDRTHRKIYVEPQDGLPAETDESQYRIPAPAAVERGTGTEIEAFTQWLQQAPPALLERANYNGSILYDIFTGRIQPSDLRDGAQPTFAHAGTGEKVSVQDAVDQTEQPLSPDQRRAMGAAIDTLTGEPDASFDDRKDVS